MKEYRFTDEQLENFVENTHLDMTLYEKQLAFTIQKDREALNQLRREIEPLAQQILSPKDNTFRRLVDLIDSRLPSSNQTDK